MTPPVTPRPVMKRRHRRRRRKDPTPEERDRMIREHIKSKGVTRVPAAYSRVD